ncbi:MAG: GAF domain-containing protein [Cyclobacteriaceae bacterium]
MTTVDTPVNETERLKKLHKYNLLDTPPDGTFDRITSVASMIFNVPIAIISLVDTDRIWFKSQYGLSVKQISRDPGLCASAILTNDLYIIEDAKEDPRSLTNPLVAGEFGLRFYAAAPLHTEENHNLGTLCILDKKPRIFSNKERDILKQLGEIVMDEMNLRLAVRETTLNVKHLTSEISDHLKDASKKIGSASGEEITSYLNASQMYLRNIQNQLNNI